MINQFSCLNCGAALPKDAPKNQNSLACEYCNQLNPNPNFTLNHAPLAEHQTTGGADTNDAIGGKTQTIKLKESPLSMLFTIGILLFGVGRFIYFWFYPQNMWIYLLTSVIMALPLFDDYFVPSRWEKVAKKATIESHEKYTISYESGGMEAFCYIACYVFLVWFTYHFFAGFIPVFDASGGREFLSGTLAFFLSMAGVWFMDKLIQTIAETAGKVFSK